MKCIYVVLLLLIIFSCSTRTEQSSSIIIESNPESAGFSSKRLDHIDSAMNDWLKKGWINGAVGMVIRHGKIVYYKAAGHNDVETQTPYLKEGLFRIASQTKAITSIAAMILFEEGKFLLNDPVSKYIPAFANSQVLDKFNEKDSTYTAKPAARQITIRDLLTHTSGIAYDFDNAIYKKHKIKTGFDVYDEELSTAMNRLGKLPLMHHPGEKFTYGLNTDVLGYLVELWSGMTLDNFFRTRIFQPLGMNDTYFNVPEEKAGRLVNYYHVDSTGFKKVDLDFPLRKKSYFSGGSGLSSTIYDYAIFLQMVLNGGEYNGTRILSRNTVRMILTDQIGDVPVPSWDPMLGVNRFGLAFSIVTEEGSRLLPHQVGTFSWGGGFTTHYWVDPKEKMVAQLYRQMDGSHVTDIDHAFKVLVYQAIVD